MRVDIWLRKRGELRTWRTHEFIPILGGKASTLFGVGSASAGHSA